MAEVNKFTRYDGGVIIYVTHIDTKKGILKGYNIFCSTPQEKEHATKNTVQGQVSVKELRKIFNKMRETPQNTKAYNIIKKAIEDLEKEKSEETKQKPKKGKDKDPKKKYLNQPELAIV